jgi:Bacterial regulatory proteins, tetR family
MCPVVDGLLRRPRIRTQQTVVATTTCPQLEQCRSRRCVRMNCLGGYPAAQHIERWIDYVYPLANIGVVSSAKLTAIPRRSYRSERRERQARETRERILAVASAEFERRGFVATSMRAVAQAAGVSVPTVELAFGTKSELLRAAISFAIRGMPSRYRC